MISNLPDGGPQEDGTEYVQQFGFVLYEAHFREPGKNATDIMLRCACSNNSTAITHSYMLEGGCERTEGCRSILSEHTQAFPKAMSFFWRLNPGPKVVMNLERGCGVQPRILLGRNGSDYYCQSVICLSTSRSTFGQSLHLSQLQAHPCLSMMVQAVLNAKRQHSAPPPSPLSENITFLVCRYLRIE